MNKYIDAEKLIKLVNRYRDNAKTAFNPIEEDADYYKGKIDTCEDIHEFITSLQQEQPKFNVGDLVVSKNNPHLTYKILATNIQNELGKTDYKVEIFTDGKPGLLSEPHNIHLISSDKIEDWGELVQQEQPEGLHFTPLNRLIQKIPSEKWNDNTNNYAKKLRDCLIKEGYLKDADVLQSYISYMNGNNVPMATMDDQEQPEVDLEKEIEKWIIKGREDFELDGWVAMGVDCIARHFYELGLNARKEE